MNERPPDDLLGYIRTLERRIADLERAPRLGHTSFQTPGTVTFTDDAGVDILYLGDFQFGGATVGMVLRDTSGTARLIFGDADSNGHTLQIRDESGNVVFADDNITGEGLSRPYLTHPFAPTDFAAVRTTTSATFQSLWRIDANIQHPEMRFSVGAASGSGGAGEFRVWDDTDGVAIGAVQTLTAGFSGVYTWNGDVPADSFGEWHQLYLQARLTNGTGNVGVEPYGIWGLRD